MRDPVFNGHGPSSSGAKWPFPDATIACGMKDEAIAHVRVQVQET